MRAVLFDFGDTLFRRAGEAEAIREIAADAGVEIARDTAETKWAEIHRRAKSPEEIALARDLSGEAHRREWTRLFSLADDLLLGMGEALYAREIDPRRWDPYPDTVETLRRLRSKGVPLAVVSDTGWDIRAVFAEHGVEDAIDVFVLSFEHGCVKPDPRLFRSACDQLGVEPGDALMVGDNFMTDGGSLSAGVPALLLPQVEPGAPRGLECVDRLF